MYFSGTQVLLYTQTLDTLSVVCSFGVAETIGTVFSVYWTCVIVVNINIYIANSDPFLPKYVCTTVKFQVFFYEVFLNEQSQCPACAQIGFENLFIKK